MGAAIGSGSAAVGTRSRALLRRLNKIQIDGSCARGFGQPGRQDLGDLGRRGGRNDVLAQGVQYPHGASLRTEPALANPPSARQDQ